MNPGNLKDFRDPENLSKFFENFPFPGKSKTRKKGKPYDDHIIIWVNNSFMLCHKLKFHKKSQLQQHKLDLQKKV